MTLNQAWLSLNRREQTAGISAAGIGFLSLAAWLCARGLRRYPALRDVLLLSALSVCLIIPVVAIGVMLTGTPMVSFSIASHAHLQPPAASTASMAKLATSPMTSPGERGKSRCSVLTVSPAHFRDWPRRRRWPR